MHNHYISLKPRADKVFFIIIVHGGKQYNLRGNITKCILDI